jgi:hypothetical protein
LEENPVLPPWHRTYDVNLEPDPAPLRHPARLLTALGAVATMIGALVLPWFNYGVDRFHSSLNALRTGNSEGLKGDTWGVYAVAAALALIAVVASRGIAESKARWIQLLPAVLGFSGLVLYWEIAAEASQLENLYGHSGYDVSSGIGVQVMLVGAIVCAVGGIASSAVTMRNNDPDGAPGSSSQATLKEPPVSDFVAELAVGAIAASVSAVAGGALAAALIPSPSLVEVIAVGVVMGGLIGAVGTDKLWRRFVSHR